MVKDVLDKWMKDSESALIATYRAKGLKASGNFETFLRSETSEFKSTMYAPQYVGVLITGRKPNSDQSDEGLKWFANWASHYIFKKWIKDKGLSLNPWGIAYHIGKFGITVPNPKNDGRLLTDTFTDTRMEDLYTSLSKHYALTIKSEIQKSWQ